MTRRNFYSFIVLMIGVSIVTYARKNLIETDKVYTEGNATYKDIGDWVKVNTTASHGAKKTEYYPEYEIDFNELKAMSKDAVAWLYCPETLIDYPIMAADDYDYYLTHLPNGTVNANGSLFIDYNCAPDFSDRLTVVYGHSMKNGAMFGSLKGYKNQNYYEEYPYMYLYTEHGNYRIDLLYGCVIAAGQWRERAFMYPDNVESLLDYGVYNSTFASDTSYEEGDRVIALSTCSYEFDDARYVLIGILRNGDTDD